MAARWGEFLYRMATILAGLIALLVIVGYFYDASRGEPIIPIVPLLLAGIIWLIGRSCRHLPVAY
jgi:uncharacterized membrane protein YjgN (DUF898 family)